MSSKQKQNTDHQISTIIEKSEDNDVEPARITGARLTLVMISLFFSLLLVSLDQSIVSTALPVIASTFKALDEVEWVGTAYILPMTSCQLLFGKLASIFGRKVILIASIILFLVGSALAGAAQNFTMLCVTRAVQGIGGAGIAPSVMMAISDLVTLRERGKYQSMVALCWATGSMAGPVVGGVLADTNWRWIFFINLPIGVLAFLLLIAFWRIPNTDTSPEPWQKQLSRIDFVGAFTFIASVVCFLLATQWGGVRYSWSSPIVIALFVIALVFLILTIIVSWKLSSEPMLELDMFYDRARSALYIAVVAIASAMFANIFYLPIYFQVANGDTPVIAGAEMLSFLVPVDLVSVISGFIVSITGHYKIMFLIGTACIAIGGGLQTMLTIDSGRAAQVCYQVVSGAGIGFCIQNLFVAAQASAPQNRVMSAIALVSFFEYFGFACGIAMGGAIFNNTLQHYLHNTTTLSMSQIKEAQRNPDMLKNIQDPNLHRMVASAFASALQRTFLALVVCGCIAFICSLFLHWKIPPTSDDDDDSVNQQDRNSASTNDNSNTRQRHHVDEEQQLSVSEYNHAFG